MGESNSSNEMNGANGIREKNWVIGVIGVIGDIGDIEGIDLFNDVEAVNSVQIVDGEGQSRESEGLRRGGRSRRRKKGSIFDNPEETEEALQEGLFL